MNNILLVEPRKRRSWGKNNQYIGLLRIANYHKSQGDRVEYIVDPATPRHHPDLIYVTSMFTYWYPEVYKAVVRYKALFPEAHLMLGGIYATLCSEHAKKSGADEVMVGQHPEAKAYPPDPSVLPYPQDFAYLFTSYGCNRACTYCATHILYGRGIRQVEPKKVIEEVQFLKERGFQRILLGDDNLLFNSEGHINLICEEIIKRKLKVGIHVPGGMAAKDFTQETACLMKAAGFKEISFAIESTSAEVRKKMGRAKNTGEEDLLQALSYADKAGFKRQETNVYFIIGLSYQTIRDMVDTLVFLVQCGVWGHPQRFTPIPNTAEWGRMGLQDWDLEDLHYKDFVAPDQENFTGADLDAIYKIARFFNIGTRYTSGFNWLEDKSRVSVRFKEALRSF